MNASDRRRFLAAVGAAATAPLLAGCSDDSGDDGPTATEAPTETPTATEPPRDRAVADGAVVDYPGFVDGAATVSEEGNRLVIEYADPERSFGLDGAFEGGSNTEELRVTRDLAVDARAGFVAPVYEKSAERFVYRVFANEAFVEYADWNVVAVEPDDELRSEGAVGFERLEGAVYGARVAPAEFQRLFVVDATARELADGASNLSGMVLLVGEAGGDGGDDDGVPEVTFRYEYDEATGELTVTHESGDTIPGEDELAVISGNVEESWTTPVGAGDTKTVAVESDATVSVVWLGSDGDSRTLSRWEGPDA